MKIHKLYITLGLMVAFVLFFEFAAHASEANESTKITFSAPIQIPGMVLPAGTYLFQQAEADSDLNVIQIFNADRSVLYATLQTASTERMEPTGGTTITLAEQGSGNPDVLVKWFYPGNTIGHEFVYPKRQAEVIAHARQQTFVGNHLMSSGEAAGE
jgi:Protein of unknown function (DUF2911)